MLQFFIEIIRFLGSLFFMFLHFLFSKKFWKQKIIALALCILLLSYWQQADTDAYWESFAKSIHAKNIHIHENFLSQIGFYYMGDNAIRVSVVIMILGLLYLMHTGIIWLKTISQRRVGRIAEPREEKQRIQRKNTIEKQTTED